MGFDFNFDIASSLHRASSMGHLELVKLLIDGGADIDAAFSDAGTPLHFAAEEGHQAVVALLLERGANVNAVRYAGCTAGWTPLHSAAGAGHEEVARILLKGGADINAGYEDEFTSVGRVLTAMQLADGDETVTKVLHGKIDLEAAHDFRSLWDRVQGQTPLMIAVKKRHVALVRLLVEEGADVNASAEFMGNPTVVCRSSNILVGSYYKERALN
jgi:ankyrin repeat protein